MGLLLDHVNVCLSKLRADPITALSTDGSTDAFRAQVAVMRAVRRIWNNRQWSFKRRTSTFSTVASTMDYVLDKSIGQPYGLLAKFPTGFQYRVRMMSRSNLDQMEPNQVRVGQPFIGIVSDLGGVTTQISSGGLVTIVSSNTLDLTQKVLVKGIVSGQEDYEELTLNGTTSVSTTKSFTSITWVTKSAITAGRVTVTTGATTLIVMGPLEKTIKLRTISLYPIPNAVYTITVRHFLKSPPLSEAYEDTGIPDEWDYVVDQWAFALALQAKGQDQGAEFAAQIKLAEQFLDVDMASEEEAYSEDPILPQRAGDNYNEQELRWVPSGFGVIDY